MWGGTLPAGGNWRSMQGRYKEGEPEGKAVDAMLNYLDTAEMDENRRSDLKYSDQSTYYNQAVQSQDRPHTVAHESTHRAVQKLSSELWGMGYIDNKTDQLITRVMDYKYGNKDAREASIPFIEHLSIDGTLEGGVNQALPIINELTDYANKAP